MSFDSDYEPFFQPPGWIIGPIWAVLYTCIALSFSSTFSKREDLENYWLILFLFIIQLSLNLVWPSVFNSEQYLLSLIMLIFMIVFTIIYAYMIYEVIPNASMLVWPYIVWIIFAAIINIAYYLNAIQ
mgnify:CR=1 FL=1